MARQQKRSLLISKRGSEHNDPSIWRGRSWPGVDYRTHLIAGRTVYWRSAGAGALRALLVPLAIVLGFGLWWQDRQVGRYGMALAFGGAAVALWHMGLYAGLVPERIQPCTATGPSCTDDNQLVFGIPIPLMALVAFVLIAVLSALSLKETQK